MTPEISPTKRPAVPKDLDRRALNPDNVRVGENLRFVLGRINEKRAKDGESADTAEGKISWRDVARAVDVNHVTIARALAGRAGLSEDLIERIAKFLAVPPGSLVAGVTDPKRYPHIPAASNRNPRDRARKGMSVSSIDSVLKHDYILSSFLGGVEEKDIKLFHRLLLDLREMAREKREAAIKVGRFNPLTRKFKSK